MAKASIPPSCTRQLVLTLCRQRKRLLHIGLRACGSSPTSLPALSRQSERQRDRRERHDSLQQEACREWHLSVGGKTLRLGLLSATGACLHWQRGSLDPADCEKDLWAVDSKFKLLAEACADYIVVGRMVRSTVQNVDIWNNAVLFSLTKNCR